MEMEYNGELKTVKVRLVEDTSIFSAKEISSPEAAVEVMKEELAKYDREVFCVLNLNTDGSVLNMNVISMGALSSTLIHPREVFKASILSNAAAIIAFHNHPSGNPTPSREDRETTRRLVECGELLGIELVDHIIVGARSQKYYSFCEHDEFEESHGRRRSGAEYER